MGIEHLIKILQASIAPCIFISGMGLLLLSLTNRLGRSTDRIRFLCHDINKANIIDIPSLQEQIKILYRRCQLLRTSIALLTSSIFFVSIIMLMLFSTLTYSIQLDSLIQFFFVVSLITLIIALVYFLLDIRLSLHSVKIEIDKILK